MSRSQTKNRPDIDRIQADNDGISDANDHDNG
jgi:hypothetical protein